jgi:acetyl esterase/lipase
VTRTCHRVLTRFKIAAYDIPTKDASVGGLFAGDPRSELVFLTFNERNAIPILLDGFRPDGQYTMPSRERIQAISPLAQVKRGRYRTPTFIVHGTHDEVVPIDMSVAFDEALRKTGTRSKLLVLPNKPHIFDLFSKPGSADWEKGVLPGYQFLYEILFG